VGERGLGPALVLWGIVLLGLLTWLLWGGFNSSVVTLVIAAVLVVVGMAWVWSRLR
jgi:hypothetical protein